MEDCDGQKAEAPRYTAHSTNVEYIWLLAFLMPPELDRNAPGAVSSRCALKRKAANGL